MYQSLEIDSVPAGAARNASDEDRNDRQTNRPRRVFGLLTLALLIVGIGWVGSQKYGSDGKKKEKEMHHLKLSGTSPVRAIVDIYLGRAVTAKEFPFIVDLVSCTGSLLSPNWVLTARHCTSVVAGKKMYAGAVDARGQGVVRTVSHVVDLTSPDTDMKLVYVSDPFLLTDAIKIVPYLFKAATDTPAEGVIGQAIGFQSGPLKMATVVVQVKDAHWKRTIACDHSPCPGTDGAVKPGDSGGPMIVHEQGHVVQWGVAKGAGASATSMLSIWDDMSYWYDWIESTMRTQPVSLPFSIGWGSTTAGTYYVVNKKSGKALTVPGSSASDTQLYQFTKGTGTNQSFELEPADQELGYYFVKSVSTQLYWDIYGNSVSNGGKLTQYTLKPTAAERKNQMFKFEQVQAGYYKITVFLSKKALDVAGNSVLDNAKLVQWDWKTSNNDNQLFQVLRV